MFFSEVAAAASSTQPRPQTDIHSLTIESISEILQVAKNIQASQVKLKDTVEKPKLNIEPQKKSGQDAVKSMNQGSSQASAGPMGTRMHFHGPQSKNLNSNRNFGQQGNQNNAPLNDQPSQQDREKSESPPVEVFLGMEGSRYERQRQREEEERRKRMEKNSFGNGGNFNGPQNRGNTSNQGIGRGNALPGRPSSSSSLTFRSGQMNPKQTSLGSNNSNLSMNIKPGHSQHSPMQNRPGQNTYDRPGQSAMNRPGQTSMNRPGQNAFNRPGQSSMNRPGQNNMNKPGQNNMNRPGQNTVNRPGQNTVNRPGQNTINRPGQPTQNHPNQPQHQGYSNLSHSGMQEKSNAESITELMTENELQSWENLQRQLRQSYLEDQISGPSVSAYDQRLKQGSQPMHSQTPQQSGSLDWFQQTKQLQMQERLKRQTAPKGILKGGMSVKL